MLERKIEPQWVDITLDEPDRCERDTVDPNILHALKRIQAADNKVLRVVYNTATAPPRIVSVYFDRRLKGKP